MPQPAPQDGPDRPIDRGAADALERALTAADGEGLRARLDAEIARLTAEFGDAADLRGEIRRALDRLQGSLYQEETRRRARTDEDRRRAVRLRLVRELLTGDAPEPTDSRWERESPYRGLWPFQADQAEVFYGRSRLTAELTGHVASGLGETGVAIVTGASGAGKSSLIRAGLIPAIAAGQLPVEGSQDWPTLTLTPGPKPLEELAARLSAITGTDAGSIRNTLAARPGDAYLYARQAVFAHTDGMSPERRDRVRDGGRLLLFCDQFEELFTLTRDEPARRAFIEALFAIAAGGDDPAGTVVIGVRGDFIDRCASIPALVPVLRRHSFVVGPPEPEELRQVITGPAAAAGLRLDDGLADDILADLRAASGGGAFTAGALPLLSQTMLSLWQRRDGDRLTRHGYTEIGGVGRAIETGTEQIYGRLDPAQRALAAELFRRLTVIDRHGDASRRHARRSRLLNDLPGLPPVLEAFTAGRLIALVGDTVEIAHDDLLRSWKRLETWLQADRVHRALLTEVADDAAEWAERGRDRSFLYQGAKFEAAQNTRTAWEANPDTYPELDTVVEEFLDAARRNTARRTRVRRAVTVSLVALLAVSLTAAGIAFNLNRVAEAANDELTAERDRLLAQDLAETSAEHAGVDGDLARLLAAAAWRIDPTQAHRNAMVRAIDDPVRYTAEPHVGDIDQIAFDPAGELLASSADGELVLWDVAERTEAARTDGLDVDELAFSPDGGELAVGSADGVHLLDPRYLSERAVLEAPTTATGLGYGPDGPLVATDNALVAIDRDSGDRSSSTWDLGAIESLAHSDDLGGYLISGSEGVWSSSGLESEPEQIWSGDGERRFSGGGRYLLEWSGGALTLIDLALGLPTRTMSLDADVTDAAVDDDGTSIALAVESGVRYIDTEDMTAVAAFDTGYAEANDISFSDDGTTMAVTGAEGTRVWELDGSGPASRPLFDEPDVPGRLVRLHPDGESVMVVDAGSHRLFDLGTGREIEVPWDSEDWIAHVAFSPAGRWITVVDGENLSEGGTVSLDLDDHATILDAETGAEHLVIEPVNGETPLFGEQTIAYGPGGRTVAAIDDTTIRIWDLEDGSLIDEATGDFSATSGLHFDSEGDRLVAIGDQTPMVWDRTEETPRALDEPDTAGSFSFDLGSTATFSHDGRHVVQTSQTDRSVKVWDAGDGAYLTVGTMTGEPLMQRHVPAREAVFGLDPSGTLYRQDLSALGDPHRSLCEATDRPLTEDEWDEHLPGIDYGSIDVCG